MFHLIGKYSVGQLQPRKCSSCCRLYLYASHTRNGSAQRVVERWNCDSVICPKCALVSSSILSRRSRLDELVTTRYTVGNLVVAHLSLEQ